MVLGVTLVPRVLRLSPLGVWRFRHSSFVSLPTLLSALATARGLSFRRLDLLADLIRSPR